VSVSVGIGHDVEAADRAMLSAKRSGRARLEIDLASATDD